MKGFRSSSSGFSLMEALIALFILSFTLLGLAGVQLKSMQSSNASFKLSIANLAVKDIYALVKREY